MTRISRRALAGFGAAGAAGLLGRSSADVPFAPIAAGDVTANTLLVKYSPYVDASAHATLQDAINVAVFVSARVVLLPTGTYTISSTLSLPTGITLLGVGAGSSINDAGPVSEIVAASGFKGPLIRNMDWQSADGNRGIVIKGLRLLAQPASPSEPSAILLRNCHGGECVIDDVIVWRGGKAGIELDNSSTTLIQNCRIGGNGTVDVGISLSISPDCRIYNNEVGGSPNGAALRMTNWSGATRVIGNNFQWSERGIEIGLGTNHCVIADNLIRQNRLEGILAGTETLGNTFTGNVFYDNGYAANPVGAGIHFAGNSRANVVTGNQFGHQSDNNVPVPQRYGVHLDDTSSACCVTGNTFEGQGAGGVLNDSTNAATNVVMGNAGQP
jgi:hypothetical protein